jgi:4,5-DOPA dioxygenase extradiol
MLSVPTNEHYLPMLYAAALQQKNENVNFVYEGIEMGSISMRCFKIA